MGKEQVEENIIELLEDICGDSIVRERRDLDLFKAGLLDSMGAIEVLVGIENEFGVEIAPTEIAREEMNTVNLIIDRVTERL